MRGRSLNDFWLFPFSSTSNSSGHKKLQMLIDTDQKQTFGLSWAEGLLIIANNHFEYLGSFLFCTETWQHQQPLQDSYSLWVIAHSTQWAIPVPPPIMTANWTGSTGNDLCFEVVLGPLSKMDEELSHSGGLFLLYITSSQLRCFMNIRRFYLNSFSAINTIPLKWGIVFIANDQETSGKIRITLGELMTPGSPRQSSKRAGDGGRRHLLSRLLLTQSVRKLNRWMDEEKEAQKYTRK